MTIKDLVKPPRKVMFQFYQDGNLWYRVDKYDFIFPVPIDDIGNATFSAEDKALLFMRYIRKQLDFLEENK